jgi:hypothetical protein
MYFNFPIKINFVRFDLRFLNIFINSIENKIKIINHYLLIKFNYFHNLHLLLILNYLHQQFLNHLLKL